MEKDCKGETDGNGRVHVESNYGIDGEKLCREYITIIEGRRCVDGEKMDSDCMHGEKTVSNGVGGEKVYNG